MGPHTPATSSVSGLNTPTDSRPNVNMNQPPQPFQPGSRGRGRGGNRGANRGTRGGTRGRGGLPRDTMSPNFQSKK